MRTIEEALKNETGGLCYGNRILLPFAVDIFKLVVEREIIMDFRDSKHGAEYLKHDDFTEVYCKDYKDLQETVSKYESIKMVVVENGKDIFDLNNHVKLLLHFKDNHVVEIERPGDDILFIE